jgi:hypothetical protein
MAKLDNNYRRKVNNTQVAGKSDANLFPFSAVVSPSNQSIMTLKSETYVP